jgi:ferric-dicitrate binding protein FerR (iron transport regulator)
MDYQNYTAEDFALDPHFRKWVLQTSIESNAFWENWLREYPQKAALLQQAQAMVRALPPKPKDLSQLEIDRIWLQIDHQIDGELEVLPSETPVIAISPESIISRTISHPKLVEPYSVYWNHHRIGRLVAAVLVFLAFSVSFLLVQQNQPPTEPDLVWVSKENPWGQRSIIYLSDGTQVHLNAGSKIEYLENFSLTERIVRLQGEAFFEVKKDPSRPFRVVSAGVVTEALGTSFNIRAYDSTRVEVALVTGKVKVSDQAADSKAEVPLTPGQGVICRIGETLGPFAFDAKSTLAWKEGEIFLENADEEKVFTSLERWYGVEIITHNQPRNVWNYTATYRKKSLDHILTSMAFVMDFDFQIQQKQVIITYH